MKYLEHIYECAHRRITTRVQVDEHMCKSQPNTPSCIDCGPYQMPLKSAGYVMSHGDLPLTLFLHEHNDGAQRKGNE